MAKIICNECKKEIDDTTKQCPNCGYRNKLNLDLYLKEQNNNSNICPNCGEKLNRKDIFCTKCGCKRNNFKTRLLKIKDLIKIIYIRNKTTTFLMGILLLFIFIGIIYCNNFSKDMLKAKMLYNNKEFDEAENIIAKYPIYFNNEIYRRIKATKNLTNYYKELNDNDDYIILYMIKIEDLLIGYEKCEEKLSIEQGEIEKQALEDLKSLFREELFNTYKLDEDDIKELNSLQEEELDSRLENIAKEAKKSNTCELRNVYVLSYDKDGYEMTVTLKNNNGCTWSIKSYSEVKVNFTDGSYEYVYLGTNINLGEYEAYTFSNCYLGSDNKYKTIKNVTFIN